MSVSRVGASEQGEFAPGLATSLRNLAQRFSVRVRGLAFEVTEPQGQPLLHTLNVI